MRAALAAPVPKLVQNQAHLHEAFQWGLAEGWNPPLKALQHYASDPNNYSIYSIEGQGTEGLVFHPNYGLVAFIGYFITNQSNRGSGIGSFILESTIKKLEVEGVKAIGLHSVPRLIGFYRRFGFKEQCALIYGSNHFIRTSVPTFNSTLKRYNQDEHFEPVVQYDQSVFGANRMRFLRTLLSDSDLSVVVSMNDKGDINGYAVLKPCVKGNYMLSVYAFNYDIAKSLTETALACGKDAYEFYLYTPAQNIARYHEYFRLVHNEEMNLTRMLKNREALSAPSPQERGVLSLEFG